MQKSIFFRPPTLPFSTQCQAAPQVRVHLTTVFLFRYPRRSGLAELKTLCEGTILVDDDVKTARHQYDLLGGGTGYWVFHILCTLSFPLASLSLPALFQALRRHRCRLLRQRLFSLTPCRVVVVSGIAFQHDIAAKRGTSDLVGSGGRWSRLDWAAAQSEQSCCRHGVFAEKTTRRDRAHAVACSIIAEREKRLRGKATSYTSLNPDRTHRPLSAMYSMRSCWRSCEKWRYTSTTIPRMRRSQSPSAFYRRVRSSWYSAYFIGPYFCYCGLLNSAERIDVELVGCTSTLTAHNVGDMVLESSGSFTPPTHLDVPGCRTWSYSCVMPVMGCTIKANIFCRAALRVGTRSASSSSTAS